MTTEQRKQHWLKLQKFKNLPVEQRRKLHKRREWFKSLPLEKRRQIRRQWQKMSPEQRNNFLDLRVGFYRLSGLIRVLSLERYQLIIGHPWPGLNVN